MEKYDLLIPCVCAHMGSLRKRSWPPPSPRAHIQILLSSHSTPHGIRKEEREGADSASGWTLKPVCVTS